MATITLKKFETSGDISDAFLYSAATSSLADSFGELEHQEGEWSDLVRRVIAVSVVEVK